MRKVLFVFCLLFIALNLSAQYQPQTYTQASGIVAPNAMFYITFTERAAHSSPVFVIVAFDRNEQEITRWKFEPSAVTNDRTFITIETANQPVYLWGLVKQ